MIRDLKNCTLIIPILVEHPDRYNNAKTVLSYINKNFRTNIFIYEIAENGTNLDFIDDLENLEIKHWVEKPEGQFHRTKYLNIMLDLVKTPVVANYDIDVLMHPDVYTESVRMIAEDNADVIYPYSFGGMSQRMVLQTPNIHERFKQNGLDLNYIDSNRDLYQLWNTEYGHCIFFKTDTYRNYGGENENFISYGPEDKERGSRFNKIGMDCRWMNDFVVYHLEHHRGPDSSNMNKACTDNWNLYHELTNLNKKETLDYYSKQEYLKKYKNIKLLGDE
jgi:hypothetical protein